MTAAPALDRDKLALLLDMLGSDHAGEIANAGRAAHKVVRAAGLSWPAVLEPDKALMHELAVAEHACRLLLDENEELKTILAECGDDWHAVGAERLPYWAVADLVDRCLMQPHRLNDWERNFLWSLAWLRRALSPKQRGCLHRIGRQLGVA